MIKFFASVFLFLGSGAAAAADLLCAADPFPFADLTVLDDERGEILRKAAEDFCLVTQGKGVRHASPDRSVALPSDGGSSYYKGDGYRLSIVQELNVIKGGQGADLEGFMYGPILVLDEAVFPGVGTPQSAVRFYTFEAFRALFSGEKRIP